MAGKWTGFIALFYTLLPFGVVGMGQLSSRVFPDIANVSEI